MNADTEYRCTNCRITATADLPQNIEAALCRAHPSGVAYGLHTWEAA